MAVLKNVIETPIHALGPSKAEATERALAQLQRVAIVRTMALEPGLVCEVLRVMRSVAEESRTMVVVTHEMGFAREVRNHLAFLHKGHIEEQVDPAEVLSRPCSERLQAFLSNSLK